MSIESLLTRIVEQNTALIAENKQQNQIILELVQENNELLLQINDEQQNGRQGRSLDD